MIMLVGDAIPREIGECTRSLEAYVQNQQESFPPNSTSKANHKASPDSEPGKLLYLLITEVAKSLCEGHRHRLK